MKKHCILWTVVITLIVSWFLFFPWSKQVLEDGGTIVYSHYQAVSRLSPVENIR